MKNKLKFFCDEILKIVKVFHIIIILNDVCSKVFYLMKLLS